MTAHKKIERIAVMIVTATLVVAFVFCNGSIFGIESRAYAIGYEERIFDTSRVHEIDIVMNDWEGFIAGCESEEYASCNVVIDGESYKNVAIRGKGNTSLSSVKRMGSERYSFKLEFDHFDDGRSYHGLDKLCLNNLIQDNTYMKDYLAYTLMNDFGVDAPLCSYAYITVNGKDWGLYLAVEAVEDSFLKRNYGDDHGELYKPDSLGFGGGRGNGRDFEMPEMPDMNDIPDAEAMAEAFAGRQMQEGAGMNGRAAGGLFGGGFGGMGSDDVKLKYIDDEPESYSNIFDNAKTDVNTADKKRLIAALKALSDSGDKEGVVDKDEVIRYFVVHGYLVNGDSYTGQMVHNYYLYEEDGCLSMIPWDYNLAFGSFQRSSAASSVNAPIDTPVSGGAADRPMIAWIFEDEESLDEYHELYEEFVCGTDVTALIDETAAMIDGFVKIDPTAFCSYEEFKGGVSAIREFAALRSESVKGQLKGDIPSTEEGQKNDPGALVDTGTLDLSAMGSMQMGMMGGRGGFTLRDDGEDNDEGKTQGRSRMPDRSGTPEMSRMPDMSNMPDMPNMPDMQGRGGFPGGMPQQEDEKASAAELILLGVLGLLLAGGILIAWKYPSGR